MGDKISDEISDDNIHDDQESEAVETISLTDFPITQDRRVSTVQDHRNPPRSSAAEDFFEFFRGGLSDNSDDKTMSHAEDIIFCGKLVPVNQQNKQTNISSKIPIIAELLVESQDGEKGTKLSTVPGNRQTAPCDSEKHHWKSQHNQPVPNQLVGCRRSRSESMAEAKHSTASPLVRPSRSLDYKRLNRNSSMSFEAVADITRDGSGKKSSSSRWYVLFFGLVKVPPPEMDIRDIKNRQVRRTTSKTPFGSLESVNVLPVSRSVDHRKCSWRVLGFLSCKSASSAAVTTPVGYMPKV